MNLYLLYMYVQGDSKKPPIVTYHDVGMNRESRISFLFLLF